LFCLFWQILGVPLFLCEPPFQWTNIFMMKTLSPPPSLVRNPRYPPFCFFLAIEDSDLLSLPEIVYPRKASFWESTALPPSLGLPRERPRSIFTPPRITNNISQGPLPVNPCGITSSPGRLPPPSRCPPYDSFQPRIHPRMDFLVAEVSEWMLFYNFPFPVA